ncbi:MAG TPA: YceI family protein [Acidimicrobiia bacterium]|nr:YceI family protein [Acidimicrobiia bacterium]
MTSETLTHTEISRSELTGDYDIDASHSRFGFVARHAMVTKVRGQFNDFEGTLRLDGENPASSEGRLVVQAKSIDTRNEDRDAHLRSNDFFAMDEFPEITFESTGVEPTDDEDKFRVTGDLTMRGVTKPVTLDVEFTGAATDPWGNTRVGLEGSATVNRKDWGINWNAALEAGGVLVSEKVTIEFEIAAVKAN